MNIFSLDGSYCLIDISNDNIISYLIASPDTSYSIPDSVITIGDNAFSSCNLTHVDISMTGSSLSSIGELAFYSCISLNSITIPNSVTDISSYAFNNCNNLTNVIFGLSCEDITFGTDVFNGVNHDISFLYPISISGATLRTFQNSVIKDIDLSYSNFRPYITRSEILELSDYNLYYNTILNQNFYDWKKITLTSLTVASTDISNLPSNLNEVILTSGITDIGSNAFQNSGLTQITIPNSVKNIGSDAFDKCNSLTNVDISMTGSSLSSIGDYAFSSCNKLTQITIPNNVIHIGDNQFNYCTSLNTCRY